MLTVDDVKARMFGAPVRVPRLTLEEELGLIASARAGNGDAFVAILAAYVPGLRRIVRNAAAKYGDEDEVFGIVVMAMWDAVLSCEEGRGLGGIAVTRVRARLNDYGDSAGVVVVPRRVADRYRAVMRDAEGSVERALELLLTGNYRLSKEAFWAVRSANESCGLSAFTEEAVNVEPVWAAQDAPRAAQRDAVASRALDVLEPAERQVIEALFGFVGDAPLNVLETSELLGLSVLEVGELKRTGLARMRKQVSA